MQTHRFDDMVGRSGRLGVLASLVLAVAGCTVSTPDPLSNRWEQDIRAFESADHDQPPPQGATLFVGSSSIRLWRTLASDFPGRSVIQRGFGGSQMSDLVDCAGRIVLPYRPSIVLVYEGDNDLAEGKTPETILADFKRFCRGVHRRLPETKIAFIAIKPSPKRRHLKDRAAKTNTLIAHYCENESRLSFVDVYSPTLDDRGEPRRELFVEDMLHLSPQGYAMWTEVIQRHLQELEARGRESRSGR